jgi:hypothetical protein
VLERGELKNRDDVVKTLENAGFEIARTTKKSISIKDPDGAKYRLKGRSMSKILDLAKSFEQTSNEQAKIQSRVATEFKKHEQRLIDLLNENEKAINSAIQEQNKRLLPIMLKTWSIVAIAVITALLLMWGILAYQSHKIGKNAEIIAQQNLAIQDLANKGAI